MTMVVCVAGVHVSVVCVSGVHDCGVVSPVFMTVVVCVSGVHDCGGVCLRCSCVCGVMCLRWS